MSPLLSILVPTSARRRAFWPWLAWNIRKQEGLEWAAVEVVTASPDAERVELDVPCRVRRTYYPRVDLPLGQIRNGLLMRATGEYVAWFDDDDWHAPDRLVRFLNPRPRRWVGNAGLAYLDLATDHVVELHHYRARTVPVTLVGRRDTLIEVPFPTDVKTGSDTRWFRALVEHEGHVGDSVRRGPLPYFFALRHGANMSPGLPGLGEGDPAILERWRGDPTWGDTDERLAQLRARLSQV